MANQWETEAANTAANNAAVQAYQRGMLELGNQQLAFQKAQQAWKETMDQAGLTGMYQGQYTMPTQQQFAEMFGVWGAPQQGQQTLAGQQQGWSQAYQNAQLYGSNVGGTGPAAGTQTLAGAEQQYTQSLRDRQQALAEEAQRQQTANQYLTLLSNLRGPADWAKYQQVLGAGGSMNSLAAAAMGQYIPGGGATSGVQPQAANLGTLYQQVAQAGGMQPQQWSNQYQPIPGGMGTAGQPQAGGMTDMRYTQPQQPGQQTMQAFQESANPAYRQQMQQARQQYQAQQQPVQTAYTMGPNSQAQNALGNGTNTMGQSSPGATQQPQYNLPAPNQISAQAWNNFTPSQKDMMLGQYEASGWYKPDVEALRNQALPKYGANAPTAGTWRLR